MRNYDQQGTPFKENIKELWNALAGMERKDGRGYVMGVLHEAMNVLVEEVRRWPKVVLFIIVALTISLLACE
jgi:hypothetical protein